LSDLHHDIASTHYKNIDMHTHTVTLHWLQFRTHNPLVFPSVSYIVTLSAFTFAVNQLDMKIRNKQMNRYQLRNGGSSLQNFRN